MKPQNAEGADKDDVAEPDQEKRHRLSENEFERTDRTHHDLLEGSNLALTHHGEGGQTHHLKQRQRSDHPGNEKPALVEPLVEPRLRFEPDAGHRHRRPAAPRSRPRRPFGRKICRDLADVPKGDQCSVGIGPIDDDLQRRAASVLKVAAEPGLDDDRDDRPVMDNVARDFAPAARHIDNIEPRGGDEMRNQAAARAALIQVENRGGHVTHRESRGIPEDHHLNDERNDQPEHHPAVAPKLEKFLHQHH